MVNLNNYYIKEATDHVKAIFLLFLINFKILVSYLYNIVNSFHH